MVEFRKNLFRKKPEEAFLIRPDLMYPDLIVARVESDLFGSPSVSDQLLRRLLLAAQFVTDFRQG